MKHIIAMAIVVTIIASFFVFSASADDDFRMTISFEYKDANHSEWTASQIAVCDTDLFAKYNALRITGITIYNPAGNHVDGIAAFRIGGYSDNLNSPRGNLSNVFNTRKDGTFSADPGSSFLNFYTSKSGFMPDRENYVSMLQSCHCSLVFSFNGNAGGALLYTFNTPIDLTYPSTISNVTYHIEYFGFTPIYSLQLYNLSNTQSSVLSSLQSLANSFGSYSSNANGFFNRFSGTSYSAFVSNISSNGSFSTSLTSNLTVLDALYQDQHTLAAQVNEQHQMQQQVNDHGAESSYSSFAGQSQFSSITAFTGIQQSANFNSGSLASESNNFLTQWFSQLCKDDIDAVSGTRSIGQLDIVDFIGNRREDDYVESD